MIQWVRLYPLNAEGTGSIPSERTKSESDSHSVVSDFLQPHRLYPTRLLCPWDSPGKNIGVNCHALLQGTFLTQESNMDILHCRRTLYHLSHQGSPHYNLDYPIWYYLCFNWIMVQEYNLFEILRHPLKLLRLALWHTICPVSINIPCSVWKEYLFSNCVCNVPSRNIRASLLTIFSILTDFLFP